MPSSYACVSMGRGTNCRLTNACCTVNPRNIETIVSRCTLQVVKSIDVPMVPTQDFKCKKKHRQGSFSMCPSLKVFSTNRTPFIRCFLCWQTNRQTDDNKRTRLITLPLVHALEVTSTSTDCGDHSFSTSLLLSNTNAQIISQEMGGRHVRTNALPLQVLTQAISFI